MHWHNNLPVSGRRMDAYRVYLLLEGGRAFLYTLVFTVNMVYQVTVVGLSPLQLVLVGTTLEATAFLFEIPTGIVADVYSRRLSILIGLVVTGFGFMVEGAIPTFAAILLAQVLWGLGFTFMSGAGQAWISDEIGEEKAGRAFLRSGQVWQLAGVVGIVASVALGSIAITLPIFLSGLLFVVLALFLAFGMPENGFTPTPPEQRNSWRTMLQTFQSGTREVRRHPRLLNVMAIGVVFGMFSEGFDRLNTAHLLQNFTLPGLGQLQPVVWFGIIGIVGMFIGMAVTEVARRRVDTSSHSVVARTLLSLNVLLIVALTGFALAGHFALALVSLWTIGALRGLIGPIYMAWVNQGLDPKVRATVLSMSSQTDAIGQIVGGPGIGVIGNLFGVRTALALGGMILSPVLPLYLRTLRRHSDSVPVAVEELIKA